jgi:RNA polymerase sigma-70 factor (ECF subfamily)
VLRRQGSRPEATSVSWDEAPASAASDRHELEEQAETSIQGQRVRAALGRLPAEQRAVLALAYFQGYTHQQIAASLGQPLGTVKTRLRLAMQKLRLLLQEPVPAPDASADPGPAYRSDRSKKGSLHDRRKARS